MIFVLDLPVFIENEDHNGNDYDLVAAPSCSG
jgi:hypothetical protein